MRNLPRLVGILTLFISSAYASAADFNVAEVRKAIVYIRTQLPGAGQAEGSGFIVSADGLIYTNRHVVEPEGNIKGATTVVGVPSAKDPDELEFFPAEKVYVSPATSGLDFAVLKIAGKDKRNFPVVALAAGRPQLGDAVAAIGYPYVKADQPSLAFNKGTISTAKRTFDDVTYCQTDAAINPGNSGGPLINTAGEVIGIVTAKKFDAENIGFALLVSEIKTASAKAGDLAAKIQPAPGPIDPKQMAHPETIKATADAWDVGSGKVTQGKGNFLIENNGGQYWIVSKKPLPENFEMTFTCQVVFLQGRMHIQPSQRTYLRLLAIRFGTDDTKTEIMEHKGYLIHFTAARASVFKEGDNEVSKTEFIGNPPDAMLITLTRKDGMITFACDRKVILKCEDKHPLHAGKVMIGGYLSALAIGEVSIVDLDSAKAGAATQPSTLPATEGAK